VLLDAAFKYGQIRTGVMKNRNIYIAWALIVILAYGCQKVFDKAQEWDESHPEQSVFSGYGSVGYPYKPN